MICTDDLTFEAQQERKRCEELIRNTMRKNQDNVLVTEKLKRLLIKVQGSDARRRKKSTGNIGGLLTVQLELPFDN
jgi:hypothetical protein